MDGGRREICVGLRAVRTGRIAPFVLFDLVRETSDDGAPLAVGAELVRRGLLTETEHHALGRARCASGLPALGPREAEAAVALGWVWPDDLAVATRILTEVAEEGGESSMGDVLVGFGLLTATQVLRLRLAFPPDRDDPAGPGAREGAA